MIDLDIKFYGDRTYIRLPDGQECMYEPGIIIEASCPLDSFLLQSPFTPFPLTSPVYQWLPFSSMSVNELSSVSWLLINFKEWKMIFELGDRLRAAVLYERSDGFIDVASWQEYRETHVWLDQPSLD